jgi:hypothetical protein
MFSRASKTLHSGCADTACADEWLCQRGLNEGWVYAQEKIKSAAGFDVRWQRLFADCQGVASGAVVHLLLPHSGWMSCVPMDEDHEVTEEAVKDMLVRVREQTLRPFMHP